MNAGFWLLKNAIKEAFGSDFATLEAHSGLSEETIDELKKLQEAYFLQFEETVKAHIAMEAKAKE